MGRVVRGGEEVTEAARGRGDGGGSGGDRGGGRAATEEKEAMKPLRPTSLTRDVISICSAWAKLGFGLGLFGLGFGSSPAT